MKANQNPHIEELSVALSRSLCELENAYDPNPDFCLLLASRRTIEDYSLQLKEILEVGKPEQKHIDWFNRLNTLLGVSLQATVTPMGNNIRYLDKSGALSVIDENKTAFLQILSSPEKRNEFLIAESAMPDISFARLEGELSWIMERQQVLFSDDIHRLVSVAMCQFRLYVDALQVQIAKGTDGDEFLDKAAKWEELAASIRSLVTAFAVFAFNFAMLEKAKSIWAIIFAALSIAVVTVWLVFGVKRFVEAVIGLFDP